ncbi:MAG TPA: hypothetical protein VE757_04965 [Gaiellaceae bacterium]|nr:hypothetical protein [Gaiellaceae bacterium]
MRFLADGAPVLSAAGWREFWRSRGMSELRALLAAEWEPLRTAGEDAADQCAFRVASLLGSRAPGSALAEELGRIRRTDLGAPPDPAEDARVARRVARWFASAPA